MQATINGCRIYYERLGPLGATNILALHSPGGSGDSRQVKEVFRPFADHFGVVVFDLRGSGRSQVAGVPSFAQLSSDTEELRRSIGLGKVIVAGSSGAGYLALEYVTRYPGSVKGLILWSTAARHTPLHVLMRKARSAGIDVDWDRFVRYWSGTCVDNQDLKDAQKDFAAINNALSPGGNKPARGRHYWRFSSHNFAMREQSGDWSVAQKLREIDVPTLVLHGDRDWIIPLRSGKELGRGIRNSEMQVFHGAGHWLHSEEKQKFEERVRSFLERQATKRPLVSVAHK